MTALPPGMKDGHCPLRGLRLFRSLFLLVATSACAFSANAVAKPTISDSYFGLYRISDDHLIGIDRFIMDSGESAALFSDYTTGVVRRLFPVSDTELAIGPTFDAAEPAVLRIRFSTDSHGAVTQIALSAAEGARTIATPVPLREEEVSFQQADATLAGTLIMPTTNGPHPAIILLHGSGPLTRHKFGPYPHFFSSLGLAVLIYDKRGSGASTGLRMDASTANVMKPSNYPDDLLGDAIAALRFLRSHEGIDAKRIGVWGTSEGGMLATQVAARTEDLAFAINSSGFMEPLWKTLRYQVEPVLRGAGASEATIKRQAAFVDLWLRVARTGKGWEEFQKQEREILESDGYWFFQTRGKYKSVEEMRWDWERILTFDPLPELAKAKCPILGVFGELDSSTPSERAAENMRQVLAHAGHTDFMTKVFPGAGHSLSVLPSKSHMAPGVFETLRSWITERVAQ